jgi:glycosyltransferase involved in cell wall biosynthesis
MHITLAASAKNEGAYVVEWVAHHLTLGFDRIIVFDNESTDDTLAILANIARVHPVVVRSWPTVEGSSPQISAFNAIFREFSGTTDLIGFFDIDEFLVCDSRNSMKSILADCLQKRPDAAAICINQLVFGDSGLSKFDAAPVLSRFERCAKPEYTENRWVKSFYRPNSLTTITGPHTSPLKHGAHVHPNGTTVQFRDSSLGQTEDIDFSLLQLNHYITKSREEFRWKQNRGGGAGRTLAERIKRYTDDGFYTGRQPHINTTTNLRTRPYAEEIAAHCAKLLQMVDSVAEPPAQSAG